MADPFIGEIRMFGFNYAPRYWAFCNGQTLPINQNQALFSLLGTTYGGNGVTTFQLPNLQGRIPIHYGSGPNLPSFQIGQFGGEETHTLTTGETPSHVHTVTATSANGTSSIATGNYIANGQADYFAAYDATKIDNLNAGAVQPAGGSQPHENRSPFLVVNFCIALTGIFPSRN